MGDKSKIEWTDATWNFIKGCTLVGPDCVNCYAMSMAKRIRAMGNPDYQNVVDDHGRWTGEIAVVDRLMNKPLEWTKPRMIFVNSMSDLFHPNVPDELILRAYGVMLKADHHIFQILTKRAERMAWFVQENFGLDLKKAKHIWHLVSAGNQETYDERTPWLYMLPAAVRGLSLEPLIGPIRLGLDKGSWGHETKHQLMDRGNNLDWVILGGESGPNARPMLPEWPTDLIQECDEYHIPIFFKQWGRWNEAGEEVGKKAAGNVIKSQTYKEFPFTLEDMKVPA